MRPVTILFAATLISLQFGSNLSASTANAPAVLPLLSQLRQLKPLPKVHYSWALPLDKLSDELLYEYVRLTHAASLSAEWCKPENIDRCVAICKKVNMTHPDIPASIGMNYSVWHCRFGKELPPTDIGPTHEAELDHLQERMVAIRNQLEASNQRHATTIAVSAILFDSERFDTRVDNVAWNKAITDKYNACFDIVQKLFPKVHVEWYARGAIQPGASATGWNQTTCFALDEKGESFGCSLYQVPEIGYTREIFRRTAQNAAKHACQTVTPWIALASGYRRQTEKYHEWSIDWNYDLIYSWQLGLEINTDWYGVPERADRFAPWNKAKIAIFYPEPFGRSPHWGQHFVAYVRGANGIKELPVDASP